MADVTADVTVDPMGIAELAERAGVTPRTIRYYVAEGLLPSPGGRGQRRAYGAEHLRRLDEIRGMKAAYLPLHEIRRRLGTGESLSPGASENRSPGARGNPSPGAWENPSPPAPLSRARERGSQLASDGDVASGAGGQIGVTASAASPGTVTAGLADGHLPFGMRGPMPVGRVEIYEPTESVWRRVVLGPDVELHFRQTDDADLNEAIQHLIREANAILDAPRRKSRRAGAGSQDPPASPSS